MSSLQTLPCEILSSILSYVIDGFEGRVEYDDGQPKSSSQVILLMSVCHCFRDVVYNFPFWYQEDFEFRKLMNPVFLDSYADAEEEAGFINSMLRDIFFVGRFSRKTAWKFSSVPSVLAVAKNIPTFTTNTTRLTLSVFETADKEWFNQIAPILQECGSLSELRITRCEQAILFDVLSRACPKLEVLEFDETPTWFATGVHEDGLRNLRQLFIKQTMNVDGDGIPFRLPLGSIGSLMDLSITFSFALDDEDDSEVTRFAQDLGQFNKLQKLTVDPCSPQVCEAIGMALFSLTTLKLAIAYGVLKVRESALVSILSAPSLRNLKELALHCNNAPHRYKSYTYSRGNPVIETITSCLTGLQDLDLVFPINVEWIEKMVRLRNLRRLAWKSYKRDLSEQTFSATGGNGNKIIADTIQMLMEMRFMEEEMGTHVEISVFDDQTPCLII